MSELTGAHFIGGEFIAEGKSRFSALNPATSEKLAPEFIEGTEGEVDRALQLANAVFDDFRSRSAEDRAKFLEAIADEIMALGDELLERAGAETGLPEARLKMERGRTVNQTRLFAQVIREGSWVDASIDTAQPDRKPMPKPDIRRMLVPLGPVVVFGASNFPLAIGVVGTDTICALGAGCPVVVKGHPAHPGTCELLARAVDAAIKSLGLPAGVFSLIQGATPATGMAMVNHPITRAVAFTGSLKAGRAIADAAAARPEPIPVYAEMGSTNPVFVLPGALSERAEQIAEGFVQSVTMGVGQFCTSPGLVFGEATGDFKKFVDAAGKAAEAAAPATMLHAGICNAYQSGLERIAAVDGVTRLGASSAAADATKTQAACVLFNTKSDIFQRNASLVEENFGPSSIIVDCDSKNVMEDIAEGLEGHLTATVHGTAEDLETHARLLSILERKVGRIVFNGFPTGIEVCPSMHHGGSYPATTHSFFTSIGTASILRFVRPLCYQGFPQEALPDELKDSNPLKIWRLVNGEMSKD